MSTPEEDDLMGIDHPIQIFDPCGCPNCNNTGYKGGTAIHEIIHCSANVRNIIAANGSKEEIEAAAKANGTKLLRDNVSELVQAGVTSMTELIRTTYTV
jgi:type IV pilus assembly protein PilB